MDAQVSGYELDTVEIDQGSGTVRSQFDRMQTPPSMAVIATLVDVMDVDPDGLEPLHGSVDPDALDALVDDRQRTTGSIHVTFSHEGHVITVSNDGGVTISHGPDPSVEPSGSDAA